MCKDFLKRGHSPRFQKIFTSIPLPNRELTCDLAKEHKLPGLTAL